MTTTPDSPDFRALCAELANSMDSETGYTKSDGTRWSHPTVVRARDALATTPPEPPTDEEIESAAKLIHASMRFAVPDYHTTSGWVERGNSLMQDEARRTARAALERWGQR